MDNSVDHSDMDTLKAHTTKLPKTTIGVDEDITETDGKKRTAHEVHVHTQRFVYIQTCTNARVLYSY